MDILQYTEYVNTHTDEIATYVDECFEQSKDFIKTKLIREIREYLSPIPFHYVRRYNHDPYDDSGILVRDGYVTLDQTITEFLQNEYSGNKEATYVSRMGWYYRTYEDELQDLTIEISAEIMRLAIRRYIENQFNACLSDNDFEDIWDTCDSCDEIYDNCVASDFFSSFSAIEFTDIGEMQLSNILKS